MYVLLYFLSPARFSPQTLYKHVGLCHSIAKYIQVSARDNVSYLKQV